MQGWQSDPPTPSPHRPCSDAGGKRGQAEEAGAVPLMLSVTSCHGGGWFREMIMLFDLHLDII